MAKNTYKQDEVLEEPFDIKHLLRASSYIKKYAKRMVFAILLSGIGGASGYVAPMIIQRALDLAIPEKNERLLFSLAAEHGIQQFAIPTWYGRVSIQFPSACVLPFFCPV